MAIETKCPICGEMVNSYFCENCGFEIHILPADISDEVKAYEQGRVAKYKETRQKLVSSEEKCEKLSGELEEQKKKDKELSDKLSSVNKEFETHKKDAASKAMYDKAKIDQLTNDLKQRNKDLEEAKRNVADAKGERPKAFILIKGVGEETVGAVYQGRNSYGCLFGGINDPNHQELSIDGLKSLHFRIETVGDRYLLHDAIGDITSANGESIGPKGRTLTNDTRFSIGKNIKVTFIIS